MERFRRDVAVAGHVFREHGTVEGLAPGQEGGGQGNADACEYLPDHVIKAGGGGHERVFYRRQHCRAQSHEYEAEADALQELGEEYVPVSDVEGEEREQVERDGIDEKPEGYQELRSRPVVEPCP